MLKLYITSNHFYALDTIAIFKWMKKYSHLYPPPDEVGAGGIGVASDVRPSRVRIFVSRAELCNPSMDFSNFWHTHPLQGVDVPFAVFEIIPT